MVELAKSMTALKGVKFSKIIIVNSNEISDLNRISDLNGISDFSIGDMNQCFGALIKSNLKNG